MFRKLRLPPLRLIECLAIVAIIAILIALAIPNVKWASSGTLKLPVRVFVFDASRRTPIENARVMVFRAAPVSDPESLTAARDYFDPGRIVDLPQQYWKPTDANGTAIVEYEFRTGANHEHPVTHAHLAYEWVRVEAEGFGGVVIPVRHASESNAVLRKQGEIVVQIGLIAANQTGGTP